MSPVLMTNPPPGLTLAVIGNPGRTRARGGAMPSATTSRAPSRGQTRASPRPSGRGAAHRRRAARALARAVQAQAPATVRAARRPRRNPSSLYWRVGTRTPWKTMPAQVRARERATLRGQTHPGVTVASVRRRVAARQAAAAGGRSARTTPALRIVTAAPTSRGGRRGSTATGKAGRKRRGVRRNPPALALGRPGFLADVRGMLPALGGLSRDPMGLLWVGGGAAGAVLGGGVMNAQLGRVLPAMPPLLARLVNTLGYAGSAAVLSRLGRSPQVRRQLLAGGLAVAVLELLKPGVTAPVVAAIPGFKQLAQPATPVMAARAPAAQADAQVKAAAVAATMPWYRSGGKLNPLNWGGGMAGSDDPALSPGGIAIDGIAGPDGAYLALLPATDTTVPVPGAPALAGSDDLGCATVAGTLPGDSPPQALPQSMPPSLLAGSAADDGSGLPLQEPVATLLGDLSCPPTGRANELTQFVRV